MIPYLMPSMVKAADAETAAMKAINPGTVTATGVSLPMLPWSTLHALRDKWSGSDRKNELAQGMTTDVGRGVGTLLGMGAARGIGETTHLLPGSPLMKMSLMLAGAAGGATLGHLKGRSVGQDLFPGSFRDRLHQAIHNF